MDTNLTENDQLDLVDRRAFDAVYWSRRFSLYHLAVLIPGIILGVYHALLGGPLYSWFVAGYFALLIGAVLMDRSLSGRDDGELPDLDQWRQNILIYAVAAGSGWGACALLVLDPSNSQSLFLVTTLTISAVAAGVLLFSSSFAAQLAFAVPALLPLLLRVAIGDLTAILGGLAVLTAVAVMVFATSRAGGLFDERTGFRLEIEDMAQKVRDAMGRVDLAESACQRMAQERDATKNEMSELSRQAQQAALAKDEFLATVSHEIRTPLNGMLPLLDLMRGTALDEEQRAHMSTILASSRHLLSIVDSMLDYSKMQAGKLELETVGFNLSDLIESVTKPLSGSATRKNVAVETEVESNVRLAVRGDPVRLRQVLTNLVSNAVKFTERGKVQVTVSSCTETQSEYRLRFRILDTGVGMDEATIAKLFEPFTQADASVTRNFGGSGLGLVICKQLVDLMGGEIGVTSTLGKGSEFWFEIPLQKAIGDITPEARRLAGVRMLMVTGDETFGRRATRFAQNSGCNVDLAGSPKDAVAKIKKGHLERGYWEVDLLAIDAASIGPQGLVLAKKIGTHPKVGKPCLIFNAGGKVPSSLSDLPKIGAVNSKCSTEDLADAIARLLDKSVESPAETAQHALEETSFKEEQPIDARVLVVEDNQINLTVASNLLKSLGLEFEVAQNGRQALELMKKGGFDAVLMDCMMPILDGYSATRQWREYEQSQGGKRLPIIAMTANAMSGDMEKCLEAGMDAYMTKPLDRHVIADTLRRLLDPEIEADEPDSVAPTHKPIETISGEMDEGVLASLTGVMGNRVQELADSYITESPAGIKRMHRALKADAMDEVAVHAHELKSTSASLGLIEVKNLCQTIELAARDGKSEAMGEALELLPQAFDRAASALRNFKPVAA